MELWNYGNMELSSYGIMELSSYGVKIGNVESGAEIIKSLKGKISRFDLFVVSSRTPTRLRRPTSKIRSLA